MHCARLWDALSSVFFHFPRSVSHSIFRSHAPPYISIPPFKHTYEHKHAHRTKNTKAQSRAHASSLLLDFLPPASLFLHFAISFLRVNFLSLFRLQDLVKKIKKYLLSSGSAITFAPGKFPFCPLFSPRISRTRSRSLFPHSYYCYTRPLSFVR